MTIRSLRKKHGLCCEPRAVAGLQELLEVQLLCFLYTYAAGSYAAMIMYGISTINPYAQYFAMKLLPQLPSLRV